MKKIYILILSAIFTFFILISYNANADLKQKCNETYSKCLQDCKKKGLSGKEIFFCQGNCGKMKQDCRKNAAAGKEYKWGDPTPK